MKVKRITQGCCGIEQGGVYEAKWEFKDFYIDIKLENGEWMTAHYFPGNFEIVEDDEAHT